MDYFLLVLTFLAALVAIKGETWNSAASGLKKVTTSGYITLAVIIASLFISGFETYKKSQQQQLDALNKSKLETLIISDISENLKTLTSPFKHLYMDNIGGYYIPEDNIELDQLLTEKALYDAQNTCFEARPKHITSTHPKTWDGIFRDDIYSGIVGLEKTVARYGNFLSPDMLSAIQDLQTKGYFSKYRNHQNQSSYDEKLPPCSIGQAIGVHKQYLTLLKRISSLNKTGKLLR